MRNKPLLKQTWFRELMIAFGVNLAAILCNIFITFGGLNQQMKIARFQALHLNKQQKYSELMQTLYLMAQGKYQTSAQTASLSLKLQALYYDLELYISTEKQREQLWKQLQTFIFNCEEANRLGTTNSKYFSDRESIRKLLHQALFDDPD